MRHTRSIPNRITYSRLVLVLLLWVPAALGERVIVGVGLALAGLTDAIDGFLARRLHATSASGSRYDSIADHVMFASTLAWLVLFRADFIRDRAPLLLVWLALGIISFVVGSIKFRRVADLHLYSAKAAVVIGMLFAVYLLIFDDYPTFFFYLTIGVAMFAIVETLLVQLTLDRVDEHLGSIFSRRFRRRVKGGHLRQDRQDDGDLA